MHFGSHGRRRLPLLLAGLLASALAHAEPAPGAKWVEPTSGMEFAWVPGGCFSQGSTQGRYNEAPVHQVCVKGFYLGTHEVTQAQYEKLMGSNPSRFKGAQKPVEQVDWPSANAAADKLSRQSGVAIRLPSESEWEFACRAGVRDGSTCGTGALADSAWFEDNSDDSTHDVGGKRPIAGGLYDMNGNVWEWMQDCYHRSYDGAPTDGSAWTTGDCDDRVTRGGGWNRDAWRARPAYRGGDGASHRDDNIGFRLVRTSP